MMLDYYARRLSAWLLPDPACATLTFVKNHRRFPRTPPVIFNEYLCDLKCSGELVRYQRYVDKIAVRDHVAEKIGRHFLVPLYGTAKRLTRADWDRLPERFIVKPNHGSGWHRVVRNKRDEEFEAVRALTDGWLRKNFYYVRREQQYRDIEPTLMFEALLAGDADEVLAEYKFFCFRGKVAYVLAMRSGDKTRRGYYDRGWNKLDVMIAPANNLDIARPGQLDEMIRVAETLAADFDFVRVDLYAARNRVYFGELTFVPGGGGWLYWPAAFAEALGRLWAGKDADLTRFRFKRERRQALGPSAPPPRAASRAAR